MARVVREDTAVDPAPAAAGWGAANIIYVLFGLLEVLLGLRLIFKLLGANPGSGFVETVYVWSEPFVSPFYGIFSAATTEGVETTSVLEPATLIAMVIYGVIAWAIVRLLTSMTTRV